MEQDTAGTDGSVGSLASIVDVNGPLAFADVLSMGADVAQALADRHAGGEAHGAVQAHAVVRGGDGPWLLAAPGLAEGPTVAAPELAEGDPATPAADVYALGATLVFALTGQAFETGALGAEEPDAAPAPAEGADNDADADADAAPGAVPEVPISARSLPDVMAAFLDTLRRTLATDPSTRGTAAALAGTLRQLRNEADRALAPPVPIVDDRPTQAVSAVELGVAAGAGAGAMALAADGAGAEGLDQAAAFGPEADGAGVGAAGVDGPDGELPVDGTQAGDATAASGARQRAPMLIAVAAVVVALILGVALVRKGDKSAELTSTALSTTTTMAPTTTAVPVTIIVPGTEVTTTVAPTTTTTKPVTTTTTAPVIVAPPVTEAPTTTVPPGTVGVTVDMSHNSSCNRCPAPLRQLPSKAGSILAQVPDKIVLFGQCWTAGDDMHDDEGNSSNQWIYVTGPVGQGWIPVLFVGRLVPAGIPACPQSTTTTAAPTTTQAPTTTTMQPVTTTTKP